MTYDMSIRTRPGEYMSDDAGYFGLNNNGMMKYERLMHYFGMMHDSKSPVEEWPSWDNSLPEDEADKKYTLEMEKTTEPHGNEPFPTIPSHKFSSNDQWIVTKEECQEALKRYEDHNASHVDMWVRYVGCSPVEYWQKWIDFLRLAAKHEGFRVM